MFLWHSISFSPLFTMSVWIIETREKFHRNHQIFLLKPLRLIWRRKFYWKKTCLFHLFWVKSPTATQASVWIEHGEYPNSLIKWRQNQIILPLDALPNSKTIWGEGIPHQLLRAKLAHLWKPIKPLISSIWGGLRHCEFQPRREHE